MPPLHQRAESGPDAGLPTECERLHTLQGLSVGDGDDALQAFFGADLARQLRGQRRARLLEVRCRRPSRRRRSGARRRGRTLPAPSGAAESAFEKAAAAAALGLLRLTEGFADLEDERFAREYLREQFDGVIVVVPLQSLGGLGVQLPQIPG